MAFPQNEIGETTSLKSAQIEREEERERRGERRNDA
jgi:hypothetical protein